MFKVPDWGDDIPKCDMHVIKLFTKKTKRKKIKSKAITNVDNSAKNKDTNHKKKNDNSIKKVENLMNRYKNVIRDDNISRKNLNGNAKRISADTNGNHKIEVENATGRKNNQKEFHKNMDVNNKFKNKMLKSKRKILKLSSTIEKNEKKNSTNINLNQNKCTSKNINNIDLDPNSLKTKQAMTYTSPDDMEVSNVDIDSLNADEPDKILLNAKTKKLNDKIKNDDVEDVLFGDNDSNKKETSNEERGICGKFMNNGKKKEKLKGVLKGNNMRSVIKTSGNVLRERMLERLKAAQFRYLNEKLYTTSGSESQELFKSDPAAFQTYHEGYQLQVKKWPVNPLDLIVKRIQKMPKTHLIADMGCGEAALSKRVLQSVRSFDLVATAPGVEACNMAHTPLLAASMDAVVFCLALMGTDLTQYLLEANRVLKIGGHLLIAEVESRFENVDFFSSDVQRLGFSLKKLDKTHQVFFFLEFNKVRDAPTKRGKLPTLSLKPCLYKRR